MGKTQTLQAEKKNIEEKIEQDGGKSLWFDLRSYGTESRIEQKIFNNETFKNWVNSEYKLFLFLDSLDEGLLRVDTLATLLAEELKQYKNAIDRLYLRIVCRTGAWLTTLETELNNLWGNEKVGVYVLAPLTQNDVELAAKENGINHPKELIDEIQAKAVIPLARKPITLNFLIKKYRKNSQLPDSQCELYEEGCLLLCNELNVNRHETKCLGNLEQNQKMAIASRIAAITIFANRYAIWSSPNVDEKPEEDITIYELCQEGDFFGERTQLTESAINETIDTGLFSSRGIQRIGWEHQTFAEFLAANFLIKNNVTPTQIMSLLTHPIGGIIPQLYETAAWLATMNFEVLNKIIEVDPEALLKNTIVTIDVKNRSALAQSLLKLYDEEKSLPTQFTRNFYHLLKYPELANHLKPYLSKPKNHFVKEVAIEIAEKCELKELQHEIANIAVDPTEYNHIRIEATRFVYLFGDSQTKVKLKELVFNKEIDEEIKGYAFRALWPDFITAEELLNNLIAQDRNILLIGGNYKDFVSNELIKGLKESDLPVALKWVEKQQGYNSLRDELGTLVYKIMKFAFKALHAPQVLELFTQAILSRLRKQGGQLVKDILSDNDDYRRIVLTKLLDIAAKNSSNLFPPFSGVYLSFSSDLLWLITKLLEFQNKYTLTIILFCSYAPTHSFDLCRYFFGALDSFLLPCKRIESGLTELIYITFIQLQRETMIEPYHLDAIINASENNESLNKEFRWLIDPVELSSEQAEKEKTRFYSSLVTTSITAEQDEPEDSPSILPFTEIINYWLDQFESGNLLAWSQIVAQISFESDKSEKGDHLEPDITKLPRWKLIDEPLKNRILIAARRYILEKNADLNEWLGKNVWPYPALDGYKALKLLIREDLKFLTSLTSEIWQNWLLVILGYPKSDDNLLSNLAYIFASTQFIEALLQLIDMKGGYVLAKVEGYFDKTLGDALLEKLTDEGLPLSTMSILLGYLLSSKSPKAKEFAVDLVLTRKALNHSNYEKAVQAAGKLILCSEDASWNILWPIFNQDPTFGKEVVPKIATIDNIPQQNQIDIRKRLSEQQLADLYIWLVHQYPYSKDPPVNYSGWGGFSPRTIIAIWRDSLLTHLQNRATVQAAEELNRISIELPQVHLLAKRYMLDTKALIRRKWKPLSSSQILKLASNKKARVVQNGEHLLDIIYEALTRLETRFQGKTGEIASAIDLWNEVSGSTIKDITTDLLKQLDKKFEANFSNAKTLLFALGKNFLYTPKDENRISDYIKRFLDIDLKESKLIINREVQFSRTDITDIKVDTYIKNSKGEPEDIITVIIEVKGIWNKEVNEAMETQLLNRYLKESSYQYGFYVVGWFNCDCWSDNDYRKQDARRIGGSDVSVVRDRFEAQAKNLSSQNKLIKSMILDITL